MIGLCHSIVLVVAHQRVTVGSVKVVLTNSLQLEWLSRGNNETTEYW